MTGRGSRLTALAFALLICAGSARGQELSTDFFPSEDELLEALQLGEITYEQYIQLLELARMPIDSTNLYLLDQIPNLSYFANTDSALTSGLEATQADDFCDHWKLAPGEQHGRVEHRYVQPIEDGASGGYRTRVLWRPDTRWRADFRLDREMSGNERVTGRSLDFRGKNRLRRIVLGNYTARLGLGTAIGYRGKLLDYSRELDDDSFVNPDYGGYNGVYVETDYGNVESAAMMSVNRDQSHRLETIGGMAAVNLDEFSPRLILSDSRLTHRATGRHLMLPSASLGLWHGYERSYIDGEINYQSRGGAAVWSGVVEGRHRRDESEIRYAFWSYGKRLADLTSGSKAGALSRTVEVEEVDFSMSDRRAGQRGGLLRTGVAPAEQWQLSGALLYAGFGRYHSNLQMSAELLRRTARWGDWQADYLGTWKERPGVVNTAEQHRWRLEHRIRLGTARLRSYIAYTRRNDDYNYISLLTNGRWETTRIGMIELWSNIGRITAQGIQYWYAYCRVEQQWHRRVSTAVKFSHTYNRTSDDRSRAQLAIEVRGVL